MHFTTFAGYEEKDLVSLKCSAVKVLTDGDDDIMPRRFEMNVLLGISGFVSLSDHVMGHGVTSTRTDPETESARVRFLTLTDNPNGPHNSSVAVLRASTIKSEVMYEPVGFPYGTIRIPRMAESEKNANT